MLGEAWVLLVGHHHAGYERSDLIALLGEVVGDVEADHRHVPMTGSDRSKNDAAAVRDRADCPTTRTSQQGGLPVVAQG
jgi:hypothetical protein